MKIILILMISLFTFLNSAMLMKSNEPTEDGLSISFDMESKDIFDFDSKFSCSNPSLNFSAKFPKITDFDSMLKFLYPAAVDPETEEFDMSALKNQIVEDLSYFTMINYTLDGITRMVLMLEEDKKNPLKKKSIAAEFKECTKNAVGDSGGTTLGVGNNSYVGGFLNYSKGALKYVGCMATAGLQGKKPSTAGEYKEYDKLYAIANKKVRNIFYKLLNGSFTISLNKDNECAGLDNAEQKGELVTITSRISEEILKTTFKNSKIVEKVKITKTNDVVKLIDNRDASQKASDNKKKNENSLDTEKMLKNKDDIVKEAYSNEITIIKKNEKEKILNLSDKEKIELIKYYSTMPISIEKPNNSRIFVDMLKRKNFFEDNINDNLTSKSAIQIKKVKEFYKKIINVKQINFRNLNLIRFFMLPIDKRKIDIDILKEMEMKLKSGIVVVSKLNSGNYSFNTLNYDIDKTNKKLKISKYAKNNIKKEVESNGGDTDLTDDQKEQIKWEKAIKDLNLKLNENNNYSNINTTIEKKVINATYYYFLSELLQSNVINVLSYFNKVIQVSDSSPLVLPYKFGIDFYHYNKYNSGINIPIIKPYQFNDNILLYQQHANNNYFNLKEEEKTEFILEINLMNLILEPIDPIKFTLYLNNIELNNQFQVEIMNNTNKYNSTKIFNPNILLDESYTTGHILKNNNNEDKYIFNKLQINQLSKSKREEDYDEKQIQVYNYKSNEIDNLSIKDIMEKKDIELKKLIVFDDNVEPRSGKDILIHNKIDTLYFSEILNMIKSNYIKKYKIELLTKVKKEKDMLKQSIYKSDKLYKRYKKNIDNNFKLEFEKASISVDIEYLKILKIINELNNNKFSFGIFNN